ncbi:MAG: ABC transporter ATP-binding protein [Lachnospiraceae bacterium]|nr:ABC transporter ATP-binding protein [Lachnospiraceae bacterium]
MPQVMIEVHELSFEYEKNIPVLKNISFHAGSGEAIGLVGANGAGKSSLLKLLVGLELSYQGIISMAGIPLSKKNLPLVRQKIGYVFQDSNNQLFMTTVYEDVAFAPRNYGLTESEVDQRVTAALNQVHISDLRQKQIYKLSGGEKKLAAIAGILSLTPDILLMDEPSAALDPKNRRNLIHILNELPQTKLIASHDLDFILGTCSRVLLLSHGELIADGPACEILGNQELLEANFL